MTAIFASHTKGSRFEDRLLPLVLLPLILLILAPVARLLLEAFDGPSGWGLSHFAKIFAAESTQTALWHSLFTAGVGTLISIVLGSLFAFVVALTDLRGKAALVFCLMIPMMIPPQITALAWTQMMGPSSVLLKSVGLAPPLGAPQPLYSDWGIALLLGIQHTSIIFLTLRAGLRMIPAEAVEAARISGAKGLRVWWQIIVPLSLPSLAAGTAMAFVTALGNFGIPAMLGIPARYSTLPTLIYQRLAGLGPSVLSEVAVLAVIIGAIALVGVLAHKLLLKRKAYGLVGTSSRPLSISLGKWRFLTELGLWLIIFCILVLPLIALVMTSLVPAYGVPLTLETLSFKGWHEALFRQPVTMRAFSNSFMLAAGAAIVLMTLCLPLAWMMQRRPSQLTRFIDSIVDLPYALPGVVLAIACILTFINLPFTDWSLYGTIWIIFIAYLARFMTVMLRPIQSSLSQLDPTMEEAAQAVGARLFKRLRTVLLPLVAPSAAAGAILVFLTAFNELTVSALLWSSGTETLGVVIFNLDDSGETVMASAVSVAVVAVVIALMGGIQLLAQRLPKGVVPWQN
ncbi:iron(III) transport system permease protein [Maritalea mobilis]|uniref:Iron(III) transport system permease protein n=1 Tax=Maritalea mobilis TaxID=483324 RepID=A0A4R6VMA3_9HYPH|nr:iron ABC transporter permease [Maritalea mobilis]TDQ60465.1 iron(III) transport system permease protein [Maritalea mobilis]